MSSEVKNERVGQLFVDQIGTRAATIDRHQLQREYLDFAGMLNDGAHADLVQSLQRRFANDPQASWLAPVFQLETNAYSSIAGKQALDFVDGLKDMPVADREKLKKVVLDAFQGPGFDPKIEIEEGPNGAKSLIIGSRGEPIHFMGMGYRLGGALKEMTERFNSGADDRSKWNFQSSYVTNRLTLGMKAAHPETVPGARGYDATIAAASNTKSHLDESPLQGSLRIDVAGRDGQFTEGASVYKVLDRPHTEHPSPISVMVSSRISWKTAFNMAAGGGQDVFHKDGTVSSYFVESGAGMDGVFRWRANA